MATDYYAVLGVSPDADIVLIKRRYRLLVRENHPDVAADKEAAHAQMQLILEAWNVLSDPEERARYDRTRQPSAPPRPPIAARPSWPTADSGAPPHKPGPGARPGSMPPRAGGWANRPGTGAPGTPASNDALRRARAAQNARSGMRSTSTRTRFLTMVFEASQLFYVEGRPEEAIRLCERVIRSDPANAEAYALLGEIHVVQGDRERALAMFERAMRCQPGNALYRQKWESLRHNGNGNGRPGNGNGHGRPGNGTPAGAEPFADARRTDLRAELRPRRRSKGCAMHLLNLIALALLGLAAWLLPFWDW